MRTLQAQILDSRLPSSFPWPASLRWRICELEGYSTLCSDPRIGNWKHGWFPGAAECQTRPSDSQQAAAPPAHTPYRHEGTWYEFVLKQFNPQDVDYGGWIERERQVFIEARLKQPRFLYSVSTTLALLLMAVVRVNC